MDRLFPSFYLNSKLDILSDLLTFRRNNLLLFCVADKKSKLKLNRNLFKDIHSFTPLK